MMAPHLSLPDKFVVCRLSVPARLLVCNANKYHESQEIARIYAFPHFAPQPVRRANLMGHWLRSRRAVQARFEPCLQRDSISRSAANANSDKWVPVVPKSGTRFDKSDSLLPLSTAVPPRARMRRPPRSDPSPAMCRRLSKAWMRRTHSSCLAAARDRFPCSRHSCRHRPMCR